MAEPKFASVIENFKQENEGYKCGYCKSNSSNYSHGIWAHQLTVTDYQDLIDRGWRRSGYYCYKPTMDKICCPMYTIKCNAVDFKLSKSQKKVIKRMNRYLEKGERGKHKFAEEDSSCPGSEETIDGNAEWNVAQQTSHVSTFNKERFEKVKTSLRICSGELSESEGNKNSESDGRKGEATSSNPKTKALDCDGTESIPGPSNTPKPGAGPSKERPPCKKAKLLRIQRKKEKMASKGLPMDVVSSLKRQDNAPKKLEDFLFPQMSTKVAHQLQLKLVRGDELASYDEMWHLFMKYQKAIHKESDEECSKETFNSFLLETPLKAWRPADGSGPPQGYGSFHQQYWLDDKLIAVGVIDILPKCVSSVYFYYDPDFSDLSLGTYGSLREVAFVRTLNLNVPELKWYYMGFYIHSCAKMRYKAGLFPSFLLCPESYTWHPIEKCFPLLDKNKYSRLETNSNLIDANSFDAINEIVVLYNLRPTYYGQYREAKGNPEDSEDEEVLHYAQLVGKTCAKRMLLLR